MNETRDFDILSPKFHANPFPELERMRATGPVVQMPLPIIGRTWLAVTHEACVELLKDHGSFVRDPGNAGSKTQERVLRVLPRTLGLFASTCWATTTPSIAGCAASSTRRSSARASPR